jgi:hypothetical protein
MDSAYFSEKIRKKTGINAFQLLLGPYFFIFFFLWAFGTERFTSALSRQASLKS